MDDKINRIMLMVNERSRKIALLEKSIDYIQKPLTLYLSPWVYGHSFGSIYTKKNTKYWKTTIVINGRRFTDTFYFRDHKNSSKLTHEYAKSYLTELSNTHGLTKNQCRFIHFKGFEYVIIKLTQDQSVIIDIYFYELIKDLKIFCINQRGRYIPMVNIEKKQKRLIIFLLESLNINCQSFKHSQNETLDLRMENIDFEKPKSIKSGGSVRLLNEKSYQGRITIDGMSFSKSFSINKYGRQSAYIKCQLWLDELNGYGIGTSEVESKLQKRCQSSNISFSELVKMTK